MSYQDYRDIVDFISKPEEAEKIYSSAQSKEFNENNRIFKPYFNEEILKLKSPQETTLEIIFGLDWVW